MALKLKVTCNAWRAIYLLVCYLPFGASPSISSIIQIEDTRHIPIIILPTPHRKERWEKEVSCTV